jgi:hypothetical protein
MEVHHKQYIEYPCVVVQLPTKLLINTTNQCLLIKKLSIADSPGIENLSEILLVKTFQRIQYLIFE